jgi:transport and Golgi organization protein 2
MCTVLIRFRPGDPTPLRFGAVRDEFVDRAWDPPAAHWGDRLLGGRDRAAGGTWLAVDPDAPAVAAILNGVRLPLPTDGVRPSRGGLPLAVLRGKPLPDPGRFDGFHLVLATPLAVRVWSWDGTGLVDRLLTPGDHVIVNQGVDRAAPAVAGLLAGTGDRDEDWWALLGAEAVLVDRTAAGRRYGSTSTSLVTLDRAGPRYAFNASPRNASGWYRVLR